MTEKTKSIDNLNEHINRPDILIGTTYKIKIPNLDHALYITINDIILNQDTKEEKKHPYEIFINSKNMEHFQWVVALTRVISAIFRNGGNIIFLLDELKSVYDPKGGYFQKGRGYVPSVVADIGYCIEEHLKHIKLIPEDSEDVKIK